MLIHSIKKTSILFLVLFIPNLICAQTTDSIPENITANDSIDNFDDFSLLMLGISYTNNNIRYKNLDNNIRIPAFSTDISFYHKSGIWSSLIYTNYYEASISTYDTEIQLGYQKTVLKFMDLDLNYGFHSFEGDDNYEGISYNHSINGSIILNTKYISFNLDTKSMFGLSDNFFTDIGVSFNLDLDNLFFENDFLLFNPSIGLAFGTDYWIFEDFNPIQKMGRMNYLSKHGFTSNRFEYQSTSFYLPIIYSYNNISLSFGWLYNIPSAKLNAINWEDQSGFMISLIYTPIF